MILSYPSAEHAALISKILHVSSKESYKTSCSEMNKLQIYASNFSGIFPFRYLNAFEMKHVIVIMRYNERANNGKLLFVFFRMLWLACRTILKLYIVKLKLFSPGIFQFILFAKLSYCSGKVKI